MPPDLAAVLVAAALAAVHLSAGALGGLERMPRSRWLSAASGISVAYVLVQLLPEVASVQEALGEEFAVPFIERHAWLLALAGLVVFYGLQQHAQRARRAGGGRTSDQVGWLHITSYASYNALIGYLLAEEAQLGLEHVALFAVAIGTHFVVNDHALHVDHGRVYDGAGRWILSAAVLAGVGVGLVAPLPEAAIGAALAFLAGSILLNVLKEELPEERQSQFVPFAVAAAAYAVLLLAV